MRYIYIVGQARSGSTILARWLSRLDGAIALGEVEAWLAGKNDTGYEHTGDLCSCGAQMNTCPIWSGVTNIAELEAKLQDMGYSIIINSQKKGRKKDAYTICIYKNLFDHYRSLLRLNKEKPLLRRVLSSLYLTYKKRKHNPSSAPVDLYVSYRSFVKDPEAVLRSVADVMGVGINKDEDSHIALSNRSKYGPLVIRPR